jgi:hypothetical protein
MDLGMKPILLHDRSASNLLRHKTVVAFQNFLFSWNRNFTTAFTKSCQWTLSWTIWLQCTISGCINLRSICFCPHVYVEELYCSWHRTTFLSQYLMVTEQRKFILMLHNVRNFSCILLNIQHNKNISIKVIMRSIFFMWFDVILTLHRR